MFTLNYDEFAAPVTIATPFSVLIAVKDVKETWQSVINVF